MNSKKPSGFQFRQERKRKEKEGKKLSGSLAKFLKATPNASIHFSNSSIANTSSCTLRRLLL